MTFLSRVTEAYERRRFAALFCTLLLTLAAEPALAHLFPGSDVLVALLTLNLIAAVCSALPRRYAWPAMAFVAVFLVFRVLRGFFADAALGAISDVAWAIVCISAATVAVQYAFRSGGMHTERIFAALDAYLIAGIVFGLCYARIEQVWPGSFAQSVPGAMTPIRALYFSFVTLVTLGYGDIVPNNDAVRGIVVLEAIGGHLYVVVLVARLVTLYSTAPPNQR